MKKTVILTEMFMDVATPSEIRKFEMLYAKSNKGSATALALRVVKDHWDLMLAKKDSPPAQLPDKEDQPRFIKINHGGNSWFERL